MRKKLVAYFSASGVAANVAKTLGATPHNCQRRGNVV